MIKQIRSSWHSVASAIAVAIVAALIGLGVAPARAAASTEMTGWTCFEWDVCHPGSQPCCFENTEIKPGEGRCSTMC